MTENPQLDLVPPLAPRLERLPRKKPAYHRPGPYWVRPHSRTDNKGVVRLVQGYWCVAGPSRRKVLSEPCKADGAYSE